MPFALLIIGIWLLISGVRNTQDMLFALLKGDFTGQDNFIFWLIAILIIGAIGYVPKLKPISTGFLVLIILVLFLKKGSSTGLGGGFFSQFISGISTTDQSSTSTTSSTTVAGLQSQLTTLEQQIQAALAANMAAEQQMQATSQ